MNPEPGTWANKQILELDVPDDEVAFYSLNGSDPVSSGFAYDGPVLLDIAGSIELRVITTKNDKVAADMTVIYTVTPAVPSDREASTFIDSVTPRGIIDYTAGTSLSIPSSLSYSLGKQPESYLKGGALSYAADCILSRDIPCTVTDGTAKWRFIIRTIPSQSGVFTRRTVPFKISDWSTITFTNSKFIYKIDDSYWAPMKDPVRLDRSVSHTIYWQSIAVSAGNPVESFELAPKPAVFVSSSKSGTVTAVLRGGDNYRFGIDINDTVVLFEIACIDTFPGDETKGILDAGIYYNAVYQGTLPVSYNVDKRAPCAPVIKSSASSFYSRKNVDVKIEGEPGSELYVAVSAPVPVTGDVPADVSHSEFNSVKADSFTLSKSGSVVLESTSENAVYYKLCAFSVDGMGNKSSVSAYDVIIDQYNYYLDASADRKDADGSRLHPFTSFEQCLDVLKTSRYAHITINGTIRMPAGESVFASNCVINGRDDARLIFDPGSSIVVRSASFSVSDCVLECSGTGDIQKNTNAAFIQLEHSVLLLKGCEVTAVFGDNGTAVTADTSVINVADSGITSKATVYTSSISSVATKVTIKNTRVSAVAATAVNFSVQGGDFELRSSSCNITGSYGRSVELFGTHSRITDNTFNADLSFGSRTGNAVYTDAKNVAVEYSGNILQGF
ncbi:MAG: hypothetical protein M0P01_14955 [Treponema sp.]|nr:hypothetical protein [Treponema sp.]